jgi:hypothetical protein
MAHSKREDTRFENYFLETIGNVLICNLLFWNSTNYGSCISYPLLSSPNIIPVATKELRLRPKLMPVKVDNEQPGTRLSYCQMETNSREHSSRTCGTVNKDSIYRGFKR